MDHNKQISEIAKRVQETMAPFIKIQTEIQRNLQPLFEHVERMNKLLEPVLRQHERFIRFLEQIEADKKDTKKVMLESGWWLTPSIMNIPAHWITSAITKYKHGDKNAIFSLYKKVYQNKNCEGLDKMMKGWKSNSLFTPWSSHLQDALEAHKQKKYTLSVPTLLLIAEGIAGKYCKKNKIEINDSSGRDKIEKAVKKHYQESANILMTDIDLLESALSSIVYKKTDKLKKNLHRNILNRHAVMHGLKSDYGSMKTSLQSFMLIDMLSELK